MWSSRLALQMNHMQLLIMRCIRISSVIDRVMWTESQDCACGKSRVSTTLILAGMVSNCSMILFGNPEGWMDWFLLACHRHFTCSWSLPLSLHSVVLFGGQSCLTRIFPTRKFWTFSSIVMNKPENFHLRRSMSFMEYKFIDRPNNGLSTRPIQKLIFLR